MLWQSCTPKAPLPQKAKEMWHVSINDSYSFLQIHQRKRHLGIHHTLIWQQLSWLNCLVIERAFLVSRKLPKSWVCSKLQGNLWWQATVSSAVIDATSVNSRKKRYWVQRKKEANDSRIFIFKINSFLKSIMQYFPRPLLRLKQKELQSIIRSELMTESEQCRSLWS